MRILKSHPKSFISRKKPDFLKKSIVNWCKDIKKKDSKKYQDKYSRTLVNIILSSMPDRKASGLGRRQKLPRAFEHVFAEVEFFDNVGTYKDLQRNRVSSTERQRYSADNLYIPPEYSENGMEGVLGDYLKLAGVTGKLQEKLIKSGKDDLVASSEYVTLLGNKFRFNVKANIRQWVFMSELRTIPGGHPTYRHAMQEAASQIIAKIPFLKPLFTHVDWIKDYGLGRLKAEVVTQERLAGLEK
jgi:hypothetical protein